MLAANAAVAKGSYPVPKAAPNVAPTVPTGVAYELLSIKLLSSMPDLEVRITLTSYDCWTCISLGGASGGVYAYRFANFVASNGLGPPEALEPAPHPHKIRSPRHTDRSTSFRMGVSSLNFPDLVLQPHLQS